MTSNNFVFSCVVVDMKNMVMHGMTFLSKDGILAYWTKTIPKSEAVRQCQII